MESFSLRKKRSSGRSARSRRRRGVANRGRTSSGADRPKRGRAHSRGRGSRTAAL